MKILLSGRSLGGAGGTSRAMYSMLHALRFDDVDVVVAQDLGDRWGPRPPQARVLSRTNWRWRASGRTLGRALLNPARRTVSPKYDVVIMQRWAQDVISPSRSSLSLVVPDGNRIQGVRASFDRVALEAPDNDRFVEEGTPTLLLPPPLLPLSSSSVRPRTTLPKAYFLTVFNPYGAIKGASDLLRAADDAPLPIVWCHKTIGPSELAQSRLVDHPRIVHVVDPSPAELRYLYESCRAYLSFSTSEGFGWAIADALRYSPKIASRPIGVLSFPEALRRDVYEIGNDWEVDWSELETHPNDVLPRELDFLTAANFRNILQATLSEVAKSVEG